MQPNEDPPLKRPFDLIVAAMAISIFATVRLANAVVARATSLGPALYRSNRTCLDNPTFSRTKLRKLRMDTPAVAIPLLDNTDAYLKPIEPFLRKTGFDELPQSWGVFAGDVTLVGRRPTLVDQGEFIPLRIERGAQALSPCFAGGAPINCRGELYSGKGAVQRRVSSGKVGRARSVNSNLDGAEGVSRTACGSLNGYKILRKGAPALPEPLPSIAGKIRWLAE